MKRVCRECGAAVPDGYTVCPLCGKVAPPAEAPPEVSRDVAELARELAAREEKAAGVGRFLKGLEAVLFVLAIPVLLPGFAITALTVKRWGSVPLSLVIVEGVLLTGLSYLSFETVDGPLAGLVFPLMLASCFCVAALFVLRAWKGRLEGGILLGYSGLVTFLMIVGGALLYAGTGLVVHRHRAPRFLKIVSDVPLRLAPDAALARREILSHLELVDAALDDANAAWRVTGGGVDVFCAAGAAEQDAEEASAIELFKSADDWLGRRVALRYGDTTAVGKQVPEDWRAHIAGAVQKGPSRFWIHVGGSAKERVYLVSPLLEEDDKRSVKEVLDLEAPVGVLAEIPVELLESTNGLDQRGRHPGDAKGLALLADASPRRFCAPVKGTSGALWVQAEGEEPPPPGTFLGVMEWPEKGAGRSLAALARRACGADASARPRVLVLGSAAAYRNAHGLTTEAAEGVPLHHWGSLLLGAILVAVAVFFALFE